VTVDDVDAAGRICELLGAGRDRFVVMTKDTQANDGTDASVLSTSLCRAALRGPRRMIGRDSEMTERISLEGKVAVVTGAG
jgi:hypothetical protein